MPKRKEWYANMLERRPIVASLYIRRQKAPSIHRALQAQGHECDVSTVYRDIEALEKIWQDELVKEPVAVRSRELAEIEEAEGQCWLNYATTRGLPWLRPLLSWKERKAKLLGLDSPTKLNVGDPNGNPLDTAPKVNIDVILNDREARYALDTLASRLESHPGVNGSKVVPG